MSNAKAKSHRPVCSAGYHPPAAGRSGMLRIDAMNRRPAIIEESRPPTPRCAANTPVTWGELYLLLQEHQPAVAAAVLIRILEKDAAFTPSQGLSPS